MYRTFIIFAYNFHLRYWVQQYLRRDSIYLLTRKKYYFQDDTKESEPQEEDDDPWAGLPYTVDLETGKLIYDVYLLPAIYVAF